MTRQILDFTDKTALVMGASRGIGLAAAQCLAAYGARVVLAARSSAAIDEAAARIVVDGGQAMAMVCDVSDPQAVLDAVVRCLEVTGCLDFVVNNAGVIEPMSALADSDPALWTQAIDINVKGVYYAMRAALPIMQRQGSGVVVNLSSGAASSILYGWSHYSASKAAVKKLTETAQLELADSGVRVVGLSPGTVATDMMAKIRDAKINVVSDLDWSVHIPPQWAGEAVAFLCGPEGAEFAGQDFRLVDPANRVRLHLPDI